MNTTDTPAGRGAAFVRVLTPSAAPTAILALGRWWHYQGAAHSIGDATLMAALATGALGAAVATRGSGSAPAYCAGVAGGLAAAAIAGYATGLALPLITWAVATALTAVAAVRARRSDQRGEVEHDRAMQVERLRAESEVQREAIRAQSRIEVANLTGQWQARAAALSAAAAPAYRFDAIDPDLLAISAEARAALASTTARLALETPTHAAPVKETASWTAATPAPAPTE